MELVLSSLEKTMINVLYGSYTNDSNRYSDEEYNFYFKLAMSLTDPKDLKKSIENLVGLSYILSDTMPQVYQREDIGENIEVPEPSMKFEDMVKRTSDSVIKGFKPNDGVEFFLKAIEGLNNMGSKWQSPTTLLTYAVIVCTVIRSNVDLKIHVGDLESLTTLYLIDRNSD